MAALPQLDYGSSNLAFGVSCAVDVLVVAGALTWALRGRHPLIRLAIAVLVAAGVLAAKGAMMVAAGLGLPFGVLHVLWLDLVIVVPLAGLYLLARGRGRVPRPVTALALVSVLLAPVGAYASLIEPARLVTERASLSLPSERAGRSPLRVAVLADLQFERLGGHERRAVQRAMRERPDVILLAGDYHQGARRTLEQELPALRELLGRLEAPGGVYAVQGDSDSAAEVRRIVAGTRVTPLHNRSATARVRDRTLTVAGIELAYRSPAARATARRLERAPGDGDVRLLLAHRPDAALGLTPRTRVDLTVAGHTHGGQLQLPLVGPLMIASHVGRRVGAGGLHRLSGRALYVSRGIGVERNQAPRLRLGAPPEVSIITLR